MEYPIPFATYQEHLKNGRFIGLRCQKCNEVQYPPRAICPTCGITTFTQVDLKGEGTIRTFTVIRVAPEGRTPPYVIVLVGLEEGPQVMGNLLGVDPNQAGMDLIGRRVVMKPHLVKGDLLLRGEFWAPGFSLK